MTRTAQLPWKTKLLKNSVSLLFFFFFYPLDLFCTCNWVNKWLILTLEQKCQWRLKDNALHTCDKQKDTLSMRAEGGYWTWHSSHQRIEMLVHAVNRPPNQWWTNTKNSQQGFCSASQKRAKQGHPVVSLWTETKETADVLKHIDD